MRPKLFFTRALKFSISYLILLALASMGTEAILAVDIVGTEALFAAGATSAKPRKLRNYDEEMARLFRKNARPATQIPLHPEKYTWRVTGSIEGKVVFTSGVPLYSFSDESWGHPLGEIPIGTIIKLEKVRLVGARHFYGVSVPATLPNGQVMPQLLWVDGLNVELAP